MNPTDPAAVEAMIERLDRMERDPIGGGWARTWPTNPDGPKAAAMLRAVAAERDEWRDKYNTLGATTMAQVDELARQAGEAKGRLEASETAGIVESWIERCKAAEAEAARLREALLVARGQFAFYVEQHRLKTPPDEAKAATNQRHVDLIDAALGEKTP